MYNTYRALFSRFLLCATSRPCRTGQRRTCPRGRPTLQGSRLHCRARCTKGQAKFILSLVHILRSSNSPDETTLECVENNKRKPDETEWRLHHLLDCTGHWEVVVFSEKKSKGRSTKVSTKNHEHALLHICKMQRVTLRLLCACFSLLFYALLHRFARLLLHFLCWKRFCYLHRLCCRFP